MLPKEENETMCRVGPGTPMGTAFRRFWIPALLSKELPHPDCDPRRVQLLGEDFVAFRDTAGNVGLLDEYCCHRNASLTLGRAEAGGLRCIYHGWKFATDGTVLETPNVADPRFKERFKARAYPSAGRGPDLGLPRPRAQAEFPKWPCFDMPGQIGLPSTPSSAATTSRSWKGLSTRRISARCIRLRSRTTDGSGSTSPKTTHMQVDSAPRIEGGHRVRLSLCRHAQHPRRRGGEGDGARRCVRASLLRAQSERRFDLCGRSGQRQPLPVHPCLVGCREEVRRRAAQEPDAHLCRARSGGARRLWPKPEDVRHAAGSEPRQRLPAGPRCPAPRAFLECPSFTRKCGRQHVRGANRDRSKEILSVGRCPAHSIAHAHLRPANKRRPGPDRLHADTAHIVGASGVLAAGAHWRSLVPTHKVSGPRASAA